MGYTAAREWTHLHDDELQLVGEEVARLAVDVHLDREADGTGPLHVVVLQRRQWGHLMRLGLGRPCRGRGLANTTWGLR